LYLIVLFGFCRNRIDRTEFFGLFGFGSCNFGFGFGSYFTEPDFCRTLIDRTELPILPECPALCGVCHHIHLGCHSTPLGGHPVGDRYPSGPLEGKKASREALGLARPSLRGLGKNCWRNGPARERSRLRPKRLAGLKRYPQRPPDFPTCGDLECRSELGISRQDYRKISSVGSLLFRNIPSSHTRSSPLSNI
jgi:hypothetical protein